MSQYKSLAASIAAGLDQIHSSWGCLVALGIMLLMQLPVSGLWFIGFAIGIEFIFDGASSIALGTALRRVPGGRAFAKA
jgi:uncharacterized membrane protein HdeD (DUF308 family)